MSTSLTTTVTNPTSPVDVNTTRRNSGCKSQRRSRISPTVRPGIISPAIRSGYRTVRSVPSGRISKPDVEGPTRTTAMRVIVAD